MVEIHSSSVGYYHCVTS